MEAATWKTVPAAIVTATRRIHPAHPAVERGHDLEQRGPPGLSGVRHARSAQRRSRRDHGRSWGVHRVVPAFRVPTGGLRDAVRGAPGPVAAGGPARTGDLVRTSSTRCSSSATQMTSWPRSTTNTSCFGHSRFVAQHHVGGLGWAKVVSSVQLLASEVVPAVRELMHR